MKTPGRSVLCALTAILWMSAVVPARAAMVTGLYEARVPVADQSSAARSAALQQAFAAVLVKVTGARSVPAPLNAVLGNAARYVQQYRYEQAPPDPNTTAANSPQTPPLLLWARFDPRVVNDAVTAAHVPLWGAERPRTLVWLALQDTPGGRLLAASDNSPLMQALQTAAQQRGVVLVFPQMDAVDRSALGMPDVTAFSADRIRQASSRYRADSILVGSIAPFGTGQYAAHWQLLNGTDQQSWETPPGDEAMTAVDGVQVSADRYAARYAIAAEAGELSGIPIAVQGVTSLGIYAKVLAYLSGLTPVHAVHVQRMAEGSAYFTLDARGTLDSLESTLVLGGLLTPVDTGVTPTAASTAPAAAAVTPLLYRYVPAP